MKNFRITLHGNMILDKTYCVKGYSENESNICQSSSTSLGSIGNTLHALATLDRDCTVNISSAIGSDQSGQYIRRWLSSFKKLNPSFSVALDLPSTTFPTSEAVIISDIAAKKRSSIVSWGACSKRTTIGRFESDWTHIMYADKLPELSIEDVKRVSRSNIVSIDLCSSNYGKETREKVVSMLPFVDFVVASTEEGMCLADSADVKTAVRSIISQCRRGVVLHSPSGSCFMSKEDKAPRMYSNVDVLEGPVNVLGAGDIFASSFIISILRGNTVHDSIAFSHNHTTLTLKERQSNGKV